MAEEGKRKNKLKEKRNEKPWCVQVDAQTVGNPKLSLPLNFSGSCTSGDARYISHAAVCFGECLYPCDKSCKT